MRSHARLYHMHQLAHAMLRGEMLLAEGLRADARPVLSLSGSTTSGFGHACMVHQGAHCLGRGVSCI